CNSINIQLAAKVANCVHSVMIVIDYPSIQSGNANVLRRLSITLGSVIKDYNRAKSSILFIITKKPKLTKEMLQDKVSEIIRIERLELQNIVDRLQGNPEDLNLQQEVITREAQIAVLSSIIAIRDNIIIADVFEGENTRTEILNRLNQLNPI